MPTRALITVAVFLAAVVAFVAINILAGPALRWARLDLTESKLYTLSAGSKKIAASLDEPVTLTLYYSEKQAADLPAQISGYAQRVREVLAEYANASGGKLRVEHVNPEPFSDAEDRAVQAGLAGLPAGRMGQERFYFGLVGRGSTDRQEVIPFLRPDREEFLEYELTRMVHLLSEPARQTVGLMSWLPITGGEPNPMTRQPGTPAWQVVRQARELFDVRTIATDATAIPADVQVLWIVHPKTVSETTLYAIDQFVLRGGRALVFVDPNCERDVPPGINPMQAMSLPKNSDLPRLFERWGIELVSGQLAADREAAIKVTVGSEGRPENVDYVLWLTLDQDNLDRKDAITGQLGSVNSATAGVLRSRAGAVTDFAPLIQTGTEGAMIAADKVAFMPDPKALLAEYQPGGAPLTIAARITGRARSAFDGPPEGAEAGPHLSQSEADINVIVVADCDLLGDQFWIREQRLGQLVLGYDKFADNGDLVIGALDNLSGSSDLISVRARGKSRRPFDRVDALRREAERRYLTREQELQARLRETEQKINDLQRQRPDAEATGGLVLLTPEQQAEIEKFRAEQVETRKALRDVRHQLGKDIEGLGRTVKLVNVALMPVLVGVGAVALGAWRARRRAQDRRAPTART